MTPPKPLPAVNPPLFARECSSLREQKFDIVEEPTQRVLATPAQPQSQYVEVCSQKFAIAQERLNAKEGSGGRTVPLLWNNRALIQTAGGHAQDAQIQRLVLIAPTDRDPRKPSKSDNLAEAQEGKEGLTVSFGMAAPASVSRIDYVIDHEAGHLNDKRSILYTLYPEKFPEFDRLQTKHTTASAELAWKEEKLGLLWQALTPQMDADQKQKFQGYLNKIESSFPPASKPEFRLQAINTMIVFANELLRYGKEKNDPRLKEEVRTKGFSPKLLARIAPSKFSSGWDKTVVLTAALLKEANLWEEFKQKHLKGTEPYLRPEEPDLIAFAQIGIQAASKYFPPSADKKKTHK